MLKLVVAKDPNQAGASYRLEVMLEWKQIPKHRDTIETFAVTDQHLWLDQLEEVQRQVAELLQPAAAS